MDTPEQFSQTLHELASDCGAHIIPAALDAGPHATMLVVPMAPTEFIALVRAVRPTIVYLLNMHVEGEVASILDDAGLEADSKPAAALRRAAEKLSRGSALPSRAIADAIVSGVRHSCYVQANWVDAFEQEAGVIVARYEDIFEEVRRRQQATDNAELQRLARALVSDPAFHSGRVSFAKRRFLAGTLFPDEDDRVLNAAVELAENMAWLESARDI